MEDASFVLASDLDARRLRSARSNSVWDTFLSRNFKHSRPVLESMDRRALEDANWRASRLAFALSRDGINSNSMALLITVWFVFDGE